MPKDIDDDDRRFTFAPTKHTESTRYFSVLFKFNRLISVCGDTKQSIRFPFRVADARKQTRKKRIKTCPNNLKFIFIISCFTGFDGLFRSISSIYNVVACRQHSFFVFGGFHVFGIAREISFWLCDPMQLVKWCIKSISKTTTKWRTKRIVNGQSFHVRTIDIAFQISFLLLWGARENVLIITGRQNDE